MAASHSKSRPCPICGGYPTSKKDRRCRGFWHSDREVVFCEQERGAPSWWRRTGAPISPLGFTLYGYKEC